MGCGGCRGQKPISIPVEVAKTPVMNPDGSIKFPEGHKVPVVDGYTVSEDDDHLLIPEDGVGCVWRISGIMLNKDGTHSPHHVCRHSQCEHRSKPVTADICRNCPFREQ